MAAEELLLSAERSVNLDRLVERAGQLYSLPAVAIQVLRLTSEPEVDLRALRDCLENDPALTSRVLRVVNSSLFGFSRKVSDLNQALALLGVRPLKMLVLGFSLPANLFAAIEGSTLRRYWQRTLTKAVAARQISEAFWNIPGDEAFLAGLLQDIGMLVLIQELDEPYLRLLSAAFSVAHDVGAFTARSLGFDHAELSARLLARWGLPESLVEGIRAGRPAERIDGLPTACRALPQILHLAELLSGLFAERRTDLLSDLAVAAQHYKKVTPGQLQQLIGALSGKVEQLASVLNIELPAGVDFTAIELEAHYRLSELTINAVGELVAAARNGEAEGRDVQRSRDRCTGPTAGLLVAASASHDGKQWHAPEPGPQRSPISVALQRGQRDTADSTPDAENDFMQQLSTALNDCRQQRQPLSLLWIGVDRPSQLTPTASSSGPQHTLALLTSICQRLEPPAKVHELSTDGRFALLLPDCDRTMAVEVGNQILRQAGHFAVSIASLSGWKVSIGAAAVAAPAKNFAPQTLLDSARRCHDAAHRSGGNAVKSIEIL